MKKTIIFFVGLFIINISYAQDLVAFQSNHLRAKYSFDLLDNSKEEPVISHNATYLQEMNLKSLAKTISSSQSKLAQFDISQLAVYDDSEKATYNVTFKSKKGKAEVVYNNDGNILATKEIYKEIKLPLEVSTKVAKENPEWAFRSNRCTILYTKKRLQKSYTIYLEKGSQKKSITITQ